LNWIVGTPLGVPVDPEVNMILATLSGVCSSRLRSTSSVGDVPVSSPSEVTTSAATPATPRAGENAPASSAKTRNGSVPARIERSLA
jgi:hypothetical protein